MTIVLNKANLAKVRDLLKPETGKPITKKLACEMLGIAYNTVRLDKLITVHYERRRRKLTEVNQLQTTKLVVVLSRI